MYTTDETKGMTKRNVNVGFSNSQVDGEREENHNGQKGPSEVQPAFVSVYPPSSLNSLDLGGA